jgi:hypothetical protein
MNIVYYVIILNITLIRSSCITRFLRNYIHLSFHSISSYFIVFHRISSYFIVFYSILQYFVTLIMNFNCNSSKDVKDAKTIKGIKTIKTIKGIKNVNDVKTIKDVKDVKDVRSTKYVNDVKDVKGTNKVKRNRNRRNRRRSQSESNIISKTIITSTKLKISESKILKNWRNSKCAGNQRKEGSSSFSSFSSCSSTTNYRHRSSSFSGKHWKMNNGDQKRTKVENQKKEQKWLDIKIALRIKKEEETLKEEAAAIKEEAIKEEAIKEEVIKEKAIKEESIKEEAIKEEAIKGKVIRINSNNLNYQITKYDVKFNNKQKTNNVLICMWMLFLVFILFCTFVHPAYLALFIGCSVCSCIVYL